MTDRAFLLWLAGRLVTHYGESDSVDFVHKLKAIANALPPKQDTPWWKNL